MTDTLGERLVRAAASHDYASAAELLSPDVEFRARTPNRGWEADTPDQVVEILDRWFEDNAEIEWLESDTVVDRPGVRYRVRWSEEGRGTFVFEQQAYYDVDDGRISRMHVLCSGDRPVEG